MTRAGNGTRSDVGAVALVLTDRLGLSFVGSRRAHLLGQIEEAMAAAGCLDSATSRSP